jgi:hypothetical protein
MGGISARNGSGKYLGSSACTSGVGKSYLRVTGIESTPEK